MKYSNSAEFIVILNIINIFITLYLNNTSISEEMNVKQCDIISQRFRYIIYFTICYNIFRIFLKNNYENILAKYSIIGIIVLHCMYSLLIRFKKNNYIFASLPFAFLTTIITVYFNFYSNVVSYYSNVILKTIAIPIQNTILVVYIVRSRILISILLNISVKSIIEYIFNFIHTENILYLTPIMIMWSGIIVKLYKKYNRDIVKYKNYIMDIELNQV